MKKLQYLFHLTLYFVSLSVFAQKEIAVTGVNKEMSRGMQPGFVVNIPETKLVDIKPAYKKKLEENTRAHARETNGELINYSVVNKDFSSKPFIVYAGMIETLEGTELTAFISEDSLNFVNESSEPGKVAVVKKSLRDFAVAEYRKVVKEQLEEENDKLSELKKMLEKQQSEEKSNTKAISDKNREIENNKAKIADSKEQQLAKSVQIATQKTLAESITDKKSPESELAQKNLKNYEDDKKDLIKDEEKYNQNINENRSAIRELERENEDLKNQQAESKKKVDAQQDVVTSVETKLNGIK